MNRRGRIFLVLSLLFVPPLILLLRRGEVRTAAHAEEASSLVQRSAAAVLGPASPQANPAVRQNLGGLPLNAGFAAPTTVSSFQPAASPPEDSIEVDGRRVHRTRILVRPRPASRNLQSALLRTIGYDVVQAYRSGWLLLDRRPNQRLNGNDPAIHLKLASEKLHASGSFSSVEFDRVVSTQAEPNDAAFVDGRLWGLRNRGQNSGVAGADVNALAAWNLTTGASNVIVAVIDTGISLTHADLASQLWLNPGEIPNNGIDDDQNGYIDDVNGINAAWPTNSAAAGNPADDHRHGTHCAGTIGAAANNGHELVGVAWNVRLMACKFLGASGFGYESDGVECIEYATANGARILSCSWGSFGFSQLLYDTLSLAGDAGVLVVAAAGNSRLDIDQFPFAPASLDLPNLISVAAIDKTDRLASFSNYGLKRCHVGAPGVDILSCDAFDDYGYLVASGTSMAGPHVAGVAALVLAQHPNISVIELRERVVSTARSTAALASHVSSGGRVDAYEALSAVEDQHLDVTVSFASASVSAEASVLLLAAGETNAVTIAAHDLRPVTNATARVRFQAGPWLSLHNDGNAPDLRADDHRYSASFIVPADTNVLALQWEIQAPGKAPTNGTVLIQPVSRPANDDFDRRQLIVGSHLRVTGSVTGATREPDERWHNGLPLGNSVWYAWIAPANGVLNLATRSAVASPGASLYRGVTVSSLLPQRTKFEPWHELLAVTPYPVESNVLYAIAVEDLRGRAGSFELALDFYSGNSPAIPPEFVFQPESLVVEEGMPFSFTSLARGAPIIHYAWYFNGAPAGTTRDLLPRAATPTNVGSYMVVASNAFGSVTSRLASLSVVPATAPPTYLQDDFEPGIDGRLWSRIPAGVHATNFGGAVSGQNGLCLDARYANLPVLTRPVNALNGGVIRFWMRAGDGSGPLWRAPHPAVNLNIGFMAPLGSPVNMAKYPPASTWQWVELAIPPEAQLPNVQFWWSANTDDHFSGDWAIDDVEIVVRTNVEPPRITVELPDVRVTQGTYWSATVGVEGSGPWTFRWYRDGALLPMLESKTIFYGLGLAGETGAYFLSASNTAGVVTSRVAQVAIVPSPTIYEALDTTNLVFTITTNQHQSYLPWRGVIDETHDGDDAWHLPYYSDDDFQPLLSTTVQGPGALSFWWKSAVNPGYSTAFSVTVNGDQQARISGNSRWRLVRIDLPEGEHGLRWGSFGDDEPFSAANARVWLDEMRFVAAPQTAPAIVQVAGVPPASQVFFTGSEHAFEVFSSGYNLVFQWSKDGTDIPGATTRRLHIASASTADSGTYSVLVSNAIGVAVSEPFLLTIVTTALSSLQLADAVDQTNLTWSTSPDAPWIRDTNIAHDGIDAARSPSGAVEDRSWIQTEVTGPGELAFWWKSSAEKTFDQLALLDNGRPVRYIDGEGEWRRETVLLLPGQHTLQWVYEADNTIHSSDDEAWLDAVSFVSKAITVEALGSAADQPGHHWSTDPVRPWFSQTNQQHDGSSAATSGMLNRGESNYIAMQVTGPATVTYWWKHGSVDTWNTMWAEIDGRRIAQLDGETAWQRAALAVPAGSHEISWWYHRYSGYFMGESQGWLDQVEVTTNRIAFAIAAAPALQGAGMTHDLNGPPGSLVIMEVSNDLTNWQPASTNFFSSAGSLRILLPFNPEAAATFYRARTVSVE